MLEELSVARAACLVSVKRYLPGEEMPLHGHDFMGLSVVLAGSLIEDVGHVRVRATPGSVVVKPRATKHANRFGSSGARLLSLTFHTDAADAMATPASWVWSRSATSLKTALHLVNALREPAGSNAFHSSLIDDAICDLRGASGEWSARTAPSWLEEIRAYLDGTHVESLSVADLARRVDRHPVYLARRFRETYGSSISMYRRRARVLAALPALTESARSMTDVAVEYGFADHSHFCRECRFVFDSTPSELRSRLK